MQEARLGRRSHPQRGVRVPEGSSGSRCLERHRSCRSRSNHFQRRHFLRRLCGHHHCPHVRHHRLHAYHHHPHPANEWGLGDVREVDVQIGRLGAAVEPPSVMVVGYARLMQYSMLGSDLLQPLSALESFGAPGALLRLMAAASPPPPE